MDPADVFGDRLPLAEQYHTSLAEVATARGFIGPREVSRLWDRHILNCAVIEKLMPEGASVIDVGSGAGLPGIALAIARPDLHVTLLEALLKRSTYLSEIVAELQLGNVSVVRGRAEEGHIKRQVAGADIVTSRAVAPLGKLAQWSLPLVKKGGEMIAMKGDTVEEELERDKQLIAKAGGGKAEVTEVEGTTVIRVPRIN